IPWSASSGATSKARTIESPTNPAATAASTGTEIFGAELFGDDVLKGRPAQYREDSVVQTEKRQVATWFGRDARADAAHDERNRKRQEEEREYQLAGPAGSCH